MATIVFTALGTAIGGPIGGAIGGLIGSQVDSSIFGGSSREGPRLKELSVTTSSYGQPIPRIFGRMRVAGSVIWSTELTESTANEGGKGQPSTTTYSYAASFAVALSSTPISRVGRIWADGNLLRGANEDLKVGGALRLYKGGGDDTVDPLIAADKGENAPAFRDCAYIVFENLQLADFGNRIPALTFEVFAPGDAQVLLDELVPTAVTDNAEAAITHARGFADEGGAIASSLAAIERVLPLTCTLSDNTLRLTTRSAFPAVVPILPEQLSARNAEDASERYRQRGQRAKREPLAVRYYDEDRDYQPGVQRANSLRVDGREVIVDLPATLTADGAKQLANANAQTSNWQSEQVVWRIGELDPAIGPGRVVRLPGTAGFWRVKSWEWYDRGIELALSRAAPGLGQIPSTDFGTPNAPVDVSPPATSLNFFELPADDLSGSDTPKIYAAPSAANSSWRGAALYAEQGSALEPIGSTGTRRSVTGALVQALAQSPALLFEADAAIELEVDSADFVFVDTDLTGIANGANRLLVGGEVMQFLGAEEIAVGRWRLTGLLRGRGGTEDAALAGHEAGTNVTVIDNSLILLQNSPAFSDQGSRIAAIGRGDTEPVYAVLENSGLSRRPMVPVHPKVSILADGGIQTCWTRRSRGAMRWDTLLEVPLIEQSEQYVVGYGDTETPAKTWLVTAPAFGLTSPEISGLLVQHGPSDLWVRQIGTYSQSPALYLTTLS